MNIEDLERQILEVAQEYKRFHLPTMRVVCTKSGIKTTMIYLPVQDTIWPYPPSWTKIGDIIMDFIWSNKLPFTYKDSIVILGEAPILRGKYSGGMSATYWPYNNPLIVEQLEELLFSTRQGQ